MNKSKVISMSLHKSGKMLLALYANGMLRLWNMMNARCTFKRKVGLVDEPEKIEEDQGEDGHYGPVKVKASKDDDDDDDIKDEEAGEDEQIELKVDLTKNDLSD
jgi:hypothetical protein